MTDIQSLTQIASPRFWRYNAIYLLSQTHFLSAVGSLVGWQASGHRWRVTTHAQQPGVRHACGQRTSLHCASSNHGGSSFKGPLKRLWSWSRIQKDRSENSKASKAGAGLQLRPEEAWRPGGCVPLWALFPLRTNSARMWNFHWHDVWEINP